MKNNPLFSIITESSDRLFVTDKSGRTVFFPWGARKQGYYIKNKSVVAKTKKFYKTSFYVCFILLIIALSLFDKNFWAIIGSMVVCFGGWYFACFLYASRIIKSLSPAKARYKEVILEKLESEDEITQPETQFPAQWSKPIPQTQKVPFSGIKRIWYRLSPGQLFMGSFLTGVIIITIWMTYFPQKFTNQPEEFFVLFLVFFFWGLSGFILAKESGTAKENAFIFYRWKLPAIITAIVFWTMALVSVYKFFFAILK